MSLRFKLHLTHNITTINNIPHLPGYTLSFIHPNHTFWFNLNRILICICPYQPIHSHFKTSNRPYFVYTTPTKNYYPIRSGPPKVSIKANLLNISDRFSTTTSTFFNSNIFRIYIYYPLTKLLTLSPF